MVTEINKELRIDQFILFRISLTQDIQLLGQENYELPANVELIVSPDAIQTTVLRQFWF